MKVYVITKGEYSDYHICAVTLDKDKAEKLAEKFTDGYYDAHIEEYDTGEEEEKLKYNALYECHYDLKSRNIKVYKHSGIDYSDLRVSKHRGEYITEVFANTEEEAIKKANDKFMKKLAEDNLL